VISERANSVTMISRDRDMKSDCRQHDVPLVPFTALQIQCEQMVAPDALAATLRKEWLKSPAREFDDGRDSGPAVVDRHDIRVSAAPTHSCGDSTQSSYTGRGDRGSNMRERSGSHIRDRSSVGGGSVLGNRDGDSWSSRSNPASRYSGNESSSRDHPRQWEAMRYNGRDGGIEGGRGCSAGSDCISGSKRSWESRTLEERKQEDRRISARSSSNETDGRLGGKDSSEGSRSYRRRGGGIPWDEDRHSRRIGGKHDRSGRGGDVDRHSRSVGDKYDRSGRGGGL
jgi:hypothetical protein